MPGTKGKHKKDDVKVSKGKTAPLAQLVEQLTLNQLVPGSSPGRCTKQKVPCGTFLFCSCIQGGAQKPKKKLDIHPNILKIELFAPQKKTQLREFSTVTFYALGSFFFRPRSRQETDWFSALGSFFFRPRSRSLSTPTNKSNLLVL